MNKRSLQVVLDARCTLTEVSPYFPIDVREPDEVMMGSIPSSVNVPLSKFEKALSLDPSDFTKQYGFHKPGKDQKLILFCLGGKRSSSALELAKGKGWKNIRNYPGSYDDVRYHLTCCTLPLGSILT